ncbi:MAG: HAMP domain-containing protein [Spirochaetaceae bacterium]|nr:HAMP domain-containing protein [Spirochaetaceae bacterium]
MRRLFRRLDLSRKLGLVFVAAAFLPCAASLAGSLALISGQESLLTREVLWGRLRLASGHYESSRASLRRDLAAAAKDNAVLVNLELDLDIALTGYLGELSRARGWDRAWVADAEGRILAAWSSPSLGPSALPLAGLPAGDPGPAGRGSGIFVEAGKRPALTGRMPLEASGGRLLGWILASVDLEAWCGSASLAARTPVFLLLEDGSLVAPEGLEVAGLSAVAATGSVGSGSPRAAVAGIGERAAGRERLEILPARIGGHDFVLGLAGYGEGAAMGARIGVAWARESVSELRRGGIAVLAVSALAALAAAALGGAYFARRAFKPLGALAEAAREIASGIYGREVATTSKDEVGDLVRDFNHMSRRLLGEERTREEAEAAMSASLHEKEVLLKEVHHRVKNNFQIINSLFELQLADEGNPALEEALRDPKARIHAMALVHDRLYQSGDFASLDFGAYIEDLAGDLYFSYAVDPARISMRVEAGHLNLDIDRAIPCGLILNELMTNALKYAFPDRERKGRILVRLDEADGRVILEVEDDGVGLPPDPAALHAQAGHRDEVTAGHGLSDAMSPIAPIAKAAPSPRGRSSLGLTLADSLALQLRGELRLFSGSGLRAVLSFPRAKAE